MNESFTKHVELHPEVYACDVLRPERHMALVEELDKFAHKAGIAAYFIYRGISEFCPSEVVEWCRMMPSRKKAGVGGLVIESHGPVDVVMSGLAGALVRNYMDARIVTTHEIIEAKGAPEAEVLLIPNFHVPGAAGNIADWNKHTLYGALLGRKMAGQMTVVQTHDLAALGSEYGSHMRDLIVSGYDRVKI